MERQCDRSAAYCCNCFGRILHECRLVLIAFWDTASTSLDVVNTLQLSIYAVLHLYCSRSMLLSIYAALHTWPIHRTFHLMNIDSILVASARSKLSRLIMRSWNLISTMERRNCIWNFFQFLDVTAFQIHPFSSLTSFCNKK